MLLRVRLIQLYSFNGGGLKAIVGMGKIGQMQSVDLDYITLMHDTCIYIYIIF